jgi:hypothetical protein
MPKPPRLARPFTQLSLLAVFVLACEAPAPAAISSELHPVRQCVFSGLQTVGVVREPALDELSGLVASRTHADVLYAHNDSGDAARFFALSTEGAPLAEFALEGAQAIDWEDLGLGPCPSGNCVFLGDIGDNDRRRADYAVYRVPEPADVRTQAVDWDRLAFRYPDAASRDAEALFVHPSTGRIYLITKVASGLSEVYRFPDDAKSGATAVLVFVSTLSLPLATDQPVTAADVAPSGRAVAVRMYNRAVEYRLPEGLSFERIFEEAPNLVPTANEPLGEAIAYTEDGRYLVTSTEKFEDDVPLSRVRCR